MMKNLHSGILRETTLGRINEPTAGAIESQATVFVIKQIEAVSNFLLLFF